MKESLYEYCVRTGSETLAAQWHPERNGDLTSADVARGSNRKVWWRCERGHEWQASVKSRVAGCGCPVCAGRVVRAGENDLASTHPELASQWHPTKNGALTPEKVTAGTLQKVWWVCDRGHTWQARVNARVHGSDCPVCAGRQINRGENDFASQYPELAAQWHPTKNGTLRPDEVSQYSNRRVWWRCELGHDYLAPVSHRTLRASGCPYCGGRRVLAGFNDLSTLRPELAAQWHEVLNAPVTPEMVTPGSHRKVWWQCGEGHVWKAVVYSRAGPQKSGCPFCAGTAKEATRRRYAVPVGRELAPRP